MLHLSIAKRRRLEEKGNCQQTEGRTAEEASLVGKEEGKGEAGARES